MCALSSEWKSNCSFTPIVSCAVSGSRQMGNIWLRAATVRRRYMIRRRVRKLGECFLVFSASFSLFFFGHTT